MVTPFNRGNTWRPDGRVRYRTDHATGERVGILPATCKRGRHTFVGGQYEATVSRPNGLEVLRVACLGCRAENDPDYAWLLTLEGPTPARAELDDRPYSDIEPRFMQRPVGR